MQTFKKIMCGLFICFLMGKANAVQSEPSEIYTIDKPAILVDAAHPIFSIKLKSNATTGFSWYLRGYDANLIQPIKHVYLPPDNKKMMGAPGFEVWTFRVKADGFFVPLQTMIHLVYTRAWQVDSQPTEVVFQVTTRHL